MVNHEPNLDYVCFLCIREDKASRSDSECNLKPIYIDEKRIFLKVKNLVMAIVSEAISTGSL